jgi:hypothetical protein
MVDTEYVSAQPYPNGVQAPVPDLPSFVSMAAAELNRVPSPGTQRRLKAETGKTFDQMVGEAADSADRFQTFIWMKLRKDHPALRWSDCAEVEIEITDGPPMVDPTSGGVSVTSPPSAASGD